jgi:hypothetical protein
MLLNFFPTSDSGLQHSLQSFFPPKLYIPSQFLYINDMSLESRLIFLVFVNSRMYVHCSVWSFHHFVLFSEETNVKSVLFNCLPLVDK